MIRYKFNEEHHHDKGTGLFTSRGVRDETIWEKITDQTTNIDCVVVRVMHGDKIAYYADAESYMNAWFGEGYFHSSEMGQVEAVRNELIPFARKIGYTIPDRWLEGYTEPTKRRDVIEVPWTFAVSVFKVHLMSAMLRQGKSPTEAKEKYERILYEEPDDEMIELVTRLVMESNKANVKK